MEQERSREQPDAAEVLPRQPYVVRSSAWTQLSGRHIGFLQLSLDDLVCLRDLYQGLREGKDLETLSAAMGVGRNKSYRLLGPLQMVDPRGHKGDVVKKLRKAENAADLPEVIFHEGLRAWLDDFASLLQRCQRGHKTIRIQGGEFSILWLLPRVLKESRFLELHPDVEMEIAQATWQEFLHGLAHDRVELGIGPAVPPERLPAAVTGEKVLTMKRALLCHKGTHRHLAQRPPGDLGLEDLRSETVFVLSGDTIPLFRMNDVLPRPQSGGRWIHVDSISHMYAYVKQGLGVAIGYEKKYGLGEPDKALTAVEFPQGVVPPAVICLYHRTDKPVPPEALALVEAIKALSRRVS
ncbi:MAG TPA: substrate-binding domain-containing protein [Gemmataceae bacterium]|nr:substrate-binding domain-containing protein [Gemmataceae bacterium]